MIESVLVLICATTTGILVAQAQDNPVRFPQLAMEQLNPKQAALAQEIVKVSSSGIGGPYNVMLRSPEMATRMFSLMDYLRFNTSVPKRLNEFAILIQARLTTSQHEWWAHQPIATKAGLSEAVASDLKEGKRPSKMAADEAAVYQFCVEMTLDHQVSDASFNKLKTVMNEQQIVDLMMVSGTYVTLSMLLNTAGVDVPKNTPLPLKPLTEAELRAGLLPVKK
jgi:4-carboxymuconolactone decarboxylase